MLKIASRHFFCGHPLQIIKASKKRKVCILKQKSKKQASKQAKNERFAYWKFPMPENFCHERIYFNCDVNFQSWCFNQSNFEDKCDISIWIKSYSRSIHSSWQDNFIDKFDIGKTRATTRGKAMTRTKAKKPRDYARMKYKFETEWCQRCCRQHAAWYTWT